MKSLSRCLIALALFAVKAEAQTYNDYSALYEQLEEPDARLLEEFNALPKPAIISQSFSDDWRFNLGSASEGLRVKTKQVEGGFVVDLPHRFEKANHPLWYYRTIYLRAPGVLNVIGDDGVQLFINGKQIKRLEGNFFPIQDIGHVSVTIRVLNNAMTGGLRSVSYYTEEDYEKLVKQNNLYDRLERIVTKTILLKHHSDSLYQKTAEAVRSVNNENIRKVEEKLHDVPLLTGPYLKRIDEGHITISCESEGHPVSLYFGERPEKLLSIKTSHADVAEFLIENLRSNTTYYYKIKSGQTESQIYSFNTKTDSVFSFHVWGDSQSGWGPFAKNIANICSRDDSFGIAVGDLVADGYRRDHWQKFIRLLSRSAAERPYYLVAGNHDYDGFYDDLVPQFYRMYINNSTPYFSWTYYNCAFIALDPNNTFPIGFPEGSDQHKWFHKTIQSPQWRNATWRFVLLHQPPYSQGWAGYQGDECVRDLLEPVIESAKIDFVITGHTHDYERLTRQYNTQKTTFFIVGGGGGSLEPEESSAEPEMDKVLKQHHFARFNVSRHEVRVEVLDQKNSVIDTYVNQKNRSD